MTVKRCIVEQMHLMDKTVVVVMFRY